MKHPIMIALLAAAMALATTASLAGEQPCGWNLMTKAEQTTFMSKLRHLRTERQRQAFVANNQQKMIGRAQAQGITLPCMAGSDKNKQK